MERYLKLITLSNIRTMLIASVTAAGFACELLPTLYTFLRHPTIIGAAELTICTLALITVALPLSQGTHLDAKPYHIMQDTVPQRIWRYTLLTAVTLNPTFATIGLGQETATGWDRAGFIGAASATLAVAFLTKTTPTVQGVLLLSTLTPAAFVSGVAGFPHNDISWTLWFTTLTVFNWVTVICDTTET